MPPADDAKIKQLTQDTKKLTADLTDVQRTENVTASTAAAFRQALQDLEVVISPMNRTAPNQVRRQYNFNI